MTQSDYSLPLERDDIGKAAYNAYCDHSNNRSLVSGDPLPTWEQQATEIKEAWVAAAQAARNVNP